VRFWALLFSEEKKERKKKKWDLKTKLRRIRPLLRNRPRLLLNLKPFYISAYFNNFLRQGSMPRFQALPGFKKVFFFTKGNIVPPPNEKI